MHVQVRRTELWDYSLNLSENQVLLGTVGGKSRVRTAEELKRCSQGGKQEYLWGHGRLEKRQDLILLDLVVSAPSGFLFTKI